eukprot:gnl/MRDRNA2_/MRDRNA2_86575_c0_seq1.p1 gnl/MRDRNA2_/MRDRNA2_86575_c0~~gnl/MRDRNA2_/MRDRNA2_86575_c0_seq1.p1  ORF type:complete len:384 (-),score=5.40 gnl/MRDRNA2_/MRDRNA2_86575_c0_seq1:957-2108(-)
MHRIYCIIRDIYRCRFPELDSIVHEPLEYAHVVKALGKETEISHVDLSTVPPLSRNIIAVTAASTSGKPLSDLSCHKVLKGCNIIIEMNADKSSVLLFIEQKMNTIAPNLSALLGTQITANLITAVGGIINLSNTPGCNIQTLGTKEKIHRSTICTDDHPQNSFVFACEIIQQTPLAWKQKALRLVSSKCALLARIDRHGCTNENEGLKVREEILALIEKWQELRTPKLKKALPMPDSANNKKRGGKKLRKFREHYGVTKAHRAQNRIGFNQPQEETSNRDDSICIYPYGHLETDYLLKNVKKKRHKNLIQNKHSMVNNTNNGVCGWSSLAFTPFQGIELHNPFISIHQSCDRNGTLSYFSEGKTSLLNNRKKSLCDSVKAQI